MTMAQHGKGRLKVIGWDPPAVAIKGWKTPLNQAQVDEVYRQWDGLGCPDIDTCAVEWSRSDDGETTLKLVVDPKALAPFDDAQVASINAYQESERLHPLTCGVDSDHGLLVAYRERARLPRLRATARGGSPCGSPTAGGGNWRDRDARREPVRLGGRRARLPRQLSRA
jgi:hypothetical protein